MRVYYNGRFMPKSAVCISPDDRGFLFADGVYEVIRSYGGRLFMPDAHFRRLRCSLDALAIAAPDLTRLEEIARQLIADNHLEQADASIYIQITRGAAPRQHTFPDTGVRPTIYVSARSAPCPREKWERGVAVLTVPDLRWMRCDIKSLALLPNVLAGEKARAAGCEEAVFLRDGYVTEGSHTSFAAFIHGRLTTHPANHLILPSVTREIVLDLCRKVAIPVKETPISESDLEDSDEILLMGTTTEIMPVVRVDDRPVSDGRPGPLTRKLQEAYRNLKMRCHTA